MLTQLPSGDWLDTAHVVGVRCPMPYGEDPHRVLIDRESPLSPLAVDFPTRNEATAWRDDFGQHLASPQDFDADLEDFLARHRMDLAILTFAIQGERGLKQCGLASDPASKVALRVLGDAIHRATEAAREEVEAAMQAAATLHSNQRPE